MKMSRTCQITNANVETISKVWCAPDTRLVYVGYMSLVSRNFVNIKFSYLDTTPIKPYNVENSLKIFVINLPY